MARRRRIPRLVAPGSQTSEVLAAILLAIAILFGAVAGQAVSTARFVVGGLGGLLFFLIAMSGRVSAIRLLFIWMILLGFIRRLLIPFAGWSLEDPLLLVGPAGAILIWLNGRHESPRRRDALSFFALLFLIWSIGQILNPLAGSVVLGLKGALFWIPPILWLFVGKTFPIKLHRNLATIIMVMAIPVAIHGLYQNAVGLLPFEYTWVGVSGFGSSIFFEGFKIRPFATLSSPQEYGVFLALANTFVWGTVLARQKHLPWRLMLQGLLIFAQFLQGTRSTFALTLLMFFVTSIVWTKSAGLKMALVGIAIALVGVVKLDLLPTDFGEGGIATAIEHQVSGFQNPEESTAGLHADMIQEGFEKAWAHPLGLGTGVTTRASEKAGTFGGTTEADITNVFISFGIPVGLFYLLFLLIAFTTSLRRFYLYKTGYAIAAFGCLIVVFGNIWNGGLYATVAILWFTIGGLSRPIDEELKESLAQGVPAEEPTAAPLPVPV